MIINRENLVRPQICSIQLVDEFLSLARQQIYSQKPVIQANPAQIAIQAAVLNQRILHQPVQIPSVGSDGQTLHSAIRLAARRISAEFQGSVRVRVCDSEL